MPAVRKDFSEAELEAELSKKGAKAWWKVSKFGEKVVLLLAGFVLTGLVGVAVSEYLKRSFALQDFKIAAYKTDLDQSQKYFDDLSSLFDRRTERLNAYVHAIVNQSGKQQDALAALDAVDQEFQGVMRRNQSEFAFVFCNASGWETSSFQDDEAAEDRCLKPFLSVAAAFEVASATARRLEPDKADQPVSRLDDTAANRPENVPSTSDLRSRVTLAYDTIASAANQAGELDRFMLGRMVDKRKAYLSALSAW